MKINEVNKEIYEKAFISDGTYGYDKITIEGTEYIVTGGNTMRKIDIT